jgi:signal transduction histidine kinase
MTTKLPHKQILIRYLTYYPYLKYSRTMSNLRIAVVTVVCCVFCLTDYLSADDLSSKYLTIGIYKLITVCAFVLLAVQIAFTKTSWRLSQLIISLLILLGTQGLMAAMSTLTPDDGAHVFYFTSLVLFIALMPVVAGLNIVFTSVSGVLSIVTFDVYFVHFESALSYDLMIAASALTSCLLVQMLTVYNKRDRIKTVQRQREVLRVERKNAELQLSDAVKNKLLYIISHDLRGPIASIKGLINLYSENVISMDEFQYHTSKLNDLLQHTSNMLDNLLHWSISLNERSLNLVRCNMFNLVNQVFAAVEKHARKKNISLINDLPSTLEVRVETPLMHLTFMNIISNAVKFTDVGSVTVRTYPSGEYIFFEIVDTGHGMGAKELMRLFDWKRIDDASGTHIGRGPGLGLLLCKQFIEKHNGNIEVESVKYSGTVVRVTLPLTLLVVNSPAGNHEELISPYAPAVTSF